jgi:uncharacterized protein (DUF1684 family)
MIERGYSERIQQWRSQREISLSDPYGWLAAAGLFWLIPGENRMGSAPESLIRLPVDTFPPYSGSFIYENDSIWLVPTHGTDIEMSGRCFERTRIVFEDDSSPEIIIGGLKMYVIRRGSRYGVRIFDPENPHRLSFTGLNWFPISKDLIIQANFTPFNTARTVQLVNILGDPVEMVSPGLFDFEIEDKNYHLQPVLADDNRFWILFRDKTNGSLTYSAGRYLYVDQPQEGSATLDFNKSYNPPCAYTAYATCPLPLPGNQIDYPIIAGEMLYP